MQPPPSYVLVEDYTKNELCDLFSNNIYCDVYMVLRYLNINLSFVTSFLQLWLYKKHNITLNIHPNNRDIPELCNSFSSHMESE